MECIQPSAFRRGENGGLFLCRFGALARGCFCRNPKQVRGHFFFKVFAKICRFEVVVLADNTIELVRQAEGQADEVAKKAAQEAAQIVDQTQNEAVRLTNEAEDAARERAAEAVAAAHQQSQQKLEAASAALAGEMEDLTAKARARQAEAIKLILGALA